MERERKLYNKFVDKLLELLDNPEISDKELKIILDFLKENNIGANPEAHTGLKSLVSRFDVELPFEVEELPMRQLD